MDRERELKKKGKHNSENYINKDIRCAEIAKHN